MPYNKKGRFQNCLRTTSQSKHIAQMVSEEKTQKSKHYRDVLKPFIGSRIEIVGQLEDVKNGPQYNSLLIRNFHISKVSAKLRCYVTGENIDHVYIAVTKDFQSQGLSTVCIKGFVYEYLSRGKRNIGIQALTVHEVIQM